MHRPLRRDNLTPQAPSFHVRNQIAHGIARTDLNTPRRAGVHGDLGDRHREEVRTVPCFLDAERHLLR